MNIIEDYITKYKINDNNISKNINNSEIVNMLEIIKNELVSLNTNLENVSNKLDNINNKLENVNNINNNINKLDNINNNLIYKIFTNNKNNIIIFTFISLSSFYIYKLK